MEKLELIEKITEHQNAIKEHLSEMDMTLFNYHAENSTRLYSEFVGLEHAIEQRFKAFEEYMRK